MRRIALGLSDAITDCSACRQPPPPRLHRRLPGAAKIAHRFVRLRWDYGDRLSIPLIDGRRGGALRFARVLARSAFLAPKRLIIRVRRTVFAASSRRSNVSRGGTTTLRGATAARAGANCAVLWRRRHKQDSGPDPDFNPEGRVTMSAPATRAALSLLWPRVRIVFTGAFGQWPNSNCR